MASAGKHGRLQLRHSSKKVVSDQFERASHASKLKQQEAKRSLVYHTGMESIDSVAAVGDLNRCREDERRNQDSKIDGQDHSRNDHECFGAAFQQMIDSLATSRVNLLRQRIKDSNENDHNDSEWKSRRDRKTTICHSDTVKERWHKWAQGKELDKTLVGYDVFFRFGGGQ